MSLDDASTINRLRAAKHPALIVFDLDGTIADSRDMARESYKRVFAMMGYGMITDELADSFNGPDADEVCRVMGIGPDRRELYDKLVDQNDVELMSTMGRMFPGTIRMLDELAPHATLAILTNGSQRYCEASIEAFALYRAAQRLCQRRDQGAANPPVAGRNGRDDCDCRRRPRDGYRKRARGGRLRHRRDLRHGRSGGAGRGGLPVRHAAGGCGLLYAPDRRTMSGCFFPRHAVQ